MVPPRRHRAARALTCGDVRSDVREPEGESAEQQDSLQPQQTIVVVVASPPGSGPRGLQQSDGVLVPQGARRQARQARHLGNRPTHAGFPSACPPDRGTGQQPRWAVTLRQPQAHADGVAAPHDIGAPSPVVTVETKGLTRCYGCGNNPHNVGTERAVDHERCNNRKATLPVPPHSPTLRSDSPHLLHQSHRALDIGPCVRPGYLVRPIPRFTPRREPRVRFGQARRYLPGGAAAAPEAVQPGLGRCRPPAVSPRAGGRARRRSQPAARKTLPYGRVRSPRGSRVRHRPRH